MPQTPYNDSEINFSAWNKIGVDSVVTGTIKPTDDGQYEISYQLSDIVRGQLNNGQSKALNEQGQLVLSKDYLLFSKRAVVPAKRLREYAHRISDLVYEQLTGEKGAF